MNLIAVNTSGFSASVALGLGCALNPNWERNPNLSHADQDSDQPNPAGRSSESVWKCNALTAEEKTAQHLVPAMESLVASSSIGIQDIDLFAVTTGPGSFTGLRIGMTTIKTLAYALSKPVVGVNSLASIAQNAILDGSWQNGRLTIVLNAFRKQFFVATFEQKSFESDAQMANDHTQTIAQADLAQYVAEIDSAVGGPGLEILDNDSRQLLENRVIEGQWNETARGVGELALRATTFSDPLSLVPRYFRGSAAEEKWVANKSNPPE